MDDKISVLIIDSESNSAQNTAELLHKDPHVFSISSAENREQGLMKIIDSIPDLILLEYSPEGEAMADLLKFIKLKLSDTRVVFISGKKEDAAYAIRQGVYSFLLKPVQKKPLFKITKEIHLEKKNNASQKIKQLIENSPVEKKSLFQTSKGYILIDPEEIMFCQAQGLYSELYLTQNRKEVVYQFISKIEELLSPELFLRVSRKYLLNKNYIRKIIKSDNSIILSHEGKEYVIKSARQHIRELTKLNPDE